MDNWLKWAFEQQLGTGEKLVLVYLASLVGAAGVGRYRREDLAAATDYEPRSLQRILKNLRDAGHLQDAGDWYSLRGSVSPQDLPPGDLQLSPPPSSATLSPGEIEGAGEAIANAMTEAGTGFLTRFNDVSLRLLLGIEKIAQAARVWEESVANAVAPPPPDPVRESAHFKVFMQSGFMAEDEAYELAKKRLEAEGAAQTMAPAAPRPVRTFEQAHPAGDFKQYLDTALGRFERVRDILDPAGEQPWADAMAAWQRLEDAENKHTVEGETDGFELLYPAIVTSARRNLGKLSLSEFLDERAIKANRAPWDQAPATANTDAAVQVELANMLDELERVNHPMCQAPPRTVDGALTEPLAAYHLRVKRVHQQLKKLQEMGV